MNRTWILIALIGGLLFSGTLQAQQPNFSGVYVSSTRAQLQLKLDGSLTIRSANGGISPGRFTVNGDTLTLIDSKGNSYPYTIRGDNLYNSSGGLAWIRQGGAPTPAAAVAAPTAIALQNADIIKLVNVGIDDGTIIAKIGASKCQFDTSTDALIQLKKSNVSAAVLKAMVGTGKSMQENGPPTSASTAPNQVAPASTSEASPQTPRTIVTPPASPCADIDYLGVIQAVTGGGQMAGINAYGGRVRNRAPYTKEVDFAWVMNGRGETGTFRVPAGEFIDVNLGQGSRPPTDVRVVTCR